MGFNRRVAPAATTHDRADHVPSDTHDGPVRPDVPEANQASTEAQKSSVRPEKPPSRTRLKAERSAATIIAVTVLDTFRLSSGAVVGNLTWEALPRLRAGSLRDAALLRLIMKHGVADPHAKVRDVIKPEDLQRMIQKAAEVADDHE